MAGFLRDVRYALRGFWRRPAFALSAILTIAIGTATLASVLSVVYTVLLRSAPYPNADRIVQIAQVINGRNLTEVSTLDVVRLRDAAPALSHVTLAWFSSASLSGDGLPERARRVYTDWQAFHMLGVRPLIGRLPTPEDEAPGADPVAVIGHRLWSDRFAADPDVIGRPLRVDGQSYVVIAVMPAGFTFPAPYWAAGDLWLLRGPSHTAWPRTRARVVLAFGLLNDGATIEQAQSQADAVAASLNASHPDAAGPIGLELTTWADNVRAGARSRMLLILGAAGVVFLIVCVNVANLLLGRGVERQRELAARVALGAGSARLARQLITETGVLFTIGGAAGVLAAVWGSRLIVAVRSFQIPRMEEAAVDGIVAAAALGITLIAAAIVGLVPTLQAVTARMSDLSAAGTRGGSGSRRWRAVQRTLVAAEVGLALVLLCGAAVLLEGAWKLARVDPGFDVRGLLHARVALPPAKYPDSRAQVDFYGRVLRGLLQIPGVSAAGLVQVAPGVGGDARPSVLLEDDPAPMSARDLRRCSLRVVSAGYLETLGLVPRAGRLFGAAEPPDVPIAIVNEAFLRQHLDGRSAVGRHVRITFGGLDTLDSQPRAIVGVIPDLKEKTLYEPAPPTVYIPLTQAEWRVALRMALLVRSGRPAADLVPPVRRAIADLDPEQAAFEFMPLSDLMETELSLNRLNLALLGVLSSVALVLAVIGVYGVTAHAVRQRTREIGIRLALGVSQRGVLRLLMQEGAALVLFGIGFGAIAAVWSAGLLRSVVHGIDRTSAATFVCAGVVLAAAALAGCYFPARRGSRVDPAVVLRSE